jgi:hypothetical protein
MFATNPTKIGQILNKKLGFFIDDFAPFKQIEKTDTYIGIPLATGELIRIDLANGIDWNQTFEGQPASSRM